MSQIDKDNSNHHNKKINNLVARTISAAVMIPSVLYITHVGSYPFTLMVLICSILMAFEWEHLTSNADSNKALWKIFGIFYIVLPCISMIWLRGITDKGELIIYWLFSVVWATDIGAYFAGCYIGGWKLAPAISPKKTWSGLIGGLICATLVGYITSYLYNPTNPEALILLSGVLGAYGQIGDLLESWIKRKFSIKDSGNLIPGHGGILDRVDSLVTVAPKVVLVLLLDKWGIF